MPRIIALGCFLLISMTGLAGCKKTKKVDYAAVKKLQDYSVPLDTAPFGEAAEKRAMFIFPHADDEVAHAGTIAYLKSRGAQIKLLTLTKGVDAEDKATRSRELDCTVKTLGIDSFKQYDYLQNQWKDIVNDSISYWNENLPAIEATISQEIAAFRPQSVYVYDTIIGGYGHHEHILTGKATFRALRKLQGGGTASVKRVYMSTLPMALDEFIIGQVESYAMFKDKNKGVGKPAPNIAYDIRPFWPQKKDAAECHESQEHVMRNFYLKPSENDTLHYQSFDREYYFLTKF